MFLEIVKIIFFLKMFSMWEGENYDFFILFVDKVNSNKML